MELRRKDEPKEVALLEDPSHGVNAERKTESKPETKANKKHTNKNQTHHQINVHPLEFVLVVQLVSRHSCVADRLWWIDSPLVLLMTESKAELNAGLVVVTGHMPAPTADVDMVHRSDASGEAAPSGLSSDQSDQGTTADECDPRAPKSRRIATPADRKSPTEWMARLCASRTDFLLTSAVPVDPSDALQGGLLLTPLLGCTARTPLDWIHAWAMLGEWAGKVAFPVPAPGVAWPRHGHGRYLRPDFIQRSPSFLTWARPIFEQGALPPMSKTESPTTERPRSAQRRPFGS